ATYEIFFLEWLFFIPAMVFIVYLENLDRYYIGNTKDGMKERLRRHNSNHKGFTGKDSDWAIVYSEKHGSKKDGYAREREVKSWKSRAKIEKLIEDNSHLTDH